VSAPTGAPALHHVQVAAPPGCEPEARRFYGELLGLTEIEKPPALRARGGAWFALASGQLHVGADPGFAPARRAHPALSLDATGLRRLADRLGAAGAPVRWDGEIPGVLRFFTDDPWGNRLELLAHDRDRPEAAGPLKPRLRGVMHQWACVCSVPLGIALVLAAEGTRARVAVTVYAITLVGLFGVSATYHRVDWRSLSARRWMRRLDHSMIFTLIAGTYTPFALIALHGTLATAILIGVWSGAAAGVVFNLLWTSAPKWLQSLLYVLLGWVVVAAVPQLASAIGAGGLVLLGLGGVLYTAGAVVYASRRPDPAPAIFGYHEIFHLLVVVAAALQYGVIAFWVVAA
jgi:hemolysin III